MKIIKLLIPAFLLFVGSYLNAQKIAVVDVQKTFDGYQKVKDARERLDRSKKIAVEELEIFRDELQKIVKELKEMEEKLKNPNIDSSDLKAKYQEKLKKAKEKQEDMVAYDKRAKATISQRQRNLLVEHLGDIRAAVKKVSASKGLDLVINSSETQLGVFYVTDKLDITQEVIGTLNTPKIK
ncbi:MAG: OmpH family outer membrane protein [Opitutales bacterium]|nr:OmpH family outer membrane protein [Opitutales bacterium]